MSRWFRYHTATLNNPKVQRLPPVLFKAWVNLLCLAADRDGDLPADNAELAFALRTTEEKARQQVDDLVTAGLLDEEDDTLRPHDWNEWQYSADARRETSTERVKRFREKRRAVSPETPRETPDETVKRVSETPSDTDSDTEQSRTEQTPKPPLALLAPHDPGPILPILDLTKGDFPGFWEVYPRHEGRRSAEKAYGQALKRASPLTILGGARRYADDPNRDPAYTKHAATWLNADGWGDDPLPAKPNGRGNPIDPLELERQLDRRLGGA